MDLGESDTQSFIVKVWIEETDPESGQVIWRGHITHVQGGERRYLKDLDGILNFIAPFLESKGVSFGLCRHVKLWLHRSERVSLRNRQGGKSTSQDRK
jgi:hypothetical protein